VPLIVVGGWVLELIGTGLGRGLPFAGKVAVFAALLVPTAAVAPLLYGRSIGLRHEQPSVPLGLDRAAVVLPPADGSPLRDAITFIRDRTAPGDPLFAYPVDPLVNFLADRPNPTRFDHFLPGARSTASASGGLKQLDGITGRVFEQDLRASRSLHHVIAKGDAVAAKAVDF
jgi:hypothetical protein